MNWIARHYESNCCIFCHHRSLSYLLNLTFIHALSFPFQARSKKVLMMMGARRLDWKWLVAALLLWKLFSCSDAWVLNLTYIHAHDWLNRITNKVVKNAKEMLGSRGEFSDSEPGIKIWCVNQYIFELIATREAITIQTRIWLVQPGKLDVGSGSNRDSYGHTYQNTPDPVRSPKLSL